MLKLVATETRSRQDIVITWILRVAVAVVFLNVGSAKFDRDNSMWVTLFAQLGLGDWFRYFTGIVQILGALLVLVPRTFLAGIGLLACTMAGAVLIWIVRFGTPGTAVIPGLLLVGLVGVGIHGARVGRRPAPGEDMPAL